MGLNHTGGVDLLRKRQTWPGLITARIALNRDIGKFAGRALDRVFDRAFIVSQTFIGSRRAGPNRGHHSADDPPRPEIPWLTSGFHVDVAYGCRPPASFSARTHSSRLERRRPRNQIWRFRFPPFPGECDGPWLRRKLKRGCGRDERPALSRRQFPGALCTKDQHRVINPMPPTPSVSAQ